MNFHEMRATSLLAKELPTSQERLCPCSRYVYFLQKMFIIYNQYTDVTIRQQTELEETIIKETEQNQLT
jgi:hypothetical protein